MRRALRALCRRARKKCALVLYGFELATLMEWLAAQGVALLRLERRRSTQSCFENLCEPRLRSGARSATRRFVPGRLTDSLTNTHAALLNVLQTSVTALTGEAMARRRINSTTTDYIAVWRVLPLVAIAAIILGSVWTVAIMTLS